MRLVFSGLEHPIEIRPGCVTTVEVHNKVLFTRMVRSLRSSKGSFAIEPYSVWEEDEQIDPQKFCVVIGDPLNLPWDNKELEGKALDRLLGDFLSDDGFREQLEGVSTDIAKEVFIRSMQFQSVYSFKIEWSLKRYLKSFGFGVPPVSCDETLLDSVIRFFDLAVDSRLNRVLVFVGLKNFLDEKEVAQLFEKAIFWDLKCLLLESIPDYSVYDSELKVIIDQDFIER